MLAVETWLLPLPLPREKRTAVLALRVHFMRYVYLFINLSLVIAHFSVAINQGTWSSRAGEFNSTWYPHSRRRGTIWSWEGCLPIFHYSTNGNHTTHYWISKETYTILDAVRWCHNLFFSLSSRPKSSGASFKRAIKRRHSSLWWGSQHRWVIYLFCLIPVFTDREWRQTTFA